MLHKNRCDLDLETCCIGDLCTLNRNGIAWPIIYGIGVNVKTGDIFPAQFSEKGPDMDIRYARTLTGGDNVGVSTINKICSDLEWANSRNNGRSRFVSTRLYLLVDSVCGLRFVVMVHFCTPNLKGISQN